MGSILGSPVCGYYDLCHTVGVPILEFRVGVRPCPPFAREHVHGSRALGRFRGGRYQGACLRTVTHILGLYGGYIGIMEKKMETTKMGYIGSILGIYWGYIGIMEKKMETTIVYGIIFLGFIVVVWVLPPLCRPLIWTVTGWGAAAKL